MFFLVLLFALFMAISVWFIWTTIIGAPWIPTSMDVVKRMIELADIQEEDVVIDLGSGDGRIIMAAAKEYKAKAIGIEADPLRLLWSRYRIRNKGLSKRSTVLWGNFFDRDLGDATIVTVY